MAKSPKRKKNKKKSDASKEWILNILKDPPETIGGDPDEDLKEYDYDDV